MKKICLLSISLLFLYNVNYSLYAQDLQREVSIYDIENQNKIYVQFKDEKTNKYGIKNIINNSVILNADFEQVWIYNDKYFVLKKNQKFALTKFSSLNQPLDYQPYSDWVFPEHNDNLGKKNIIISIGEKRGLLDENLNPILPVEYDYINTGLSDEVIVGKLQKKGIYNIGFGKIVVPIIYQDISVVGNAYVVNQANKLGLLNKKHAFDIDPSKYSFSEFYSINTNFIRFKKDSLYGLINTKTKKILLPEKYTSINGFWRGMNGDSSKFIFQVQSSKKFGLINQEFKEILSPLYSQMYYENFTKDNAEITIYDDRSCGLFNGKLEKIVIPTIYKGILVNYQWLPFSKRFYQLTHNDNTYSLLDSKYKTIWGDNYSEINLHSNYNSNAKKYRSYIHFMKNGKHGVYLIKNTNKSFPVEYDSFEELSETDNFIIGNGQNKIIYNDEGQILFDNLKTTKYLGIVRGLRYKYFYEIALKNLKNETALLNFYTNKLQLPFEYDNITIRYFDNYIAKKNAKFGLVDLKGNIKVPFEYDTLYCSIPYMKYNHILGKQKGLFGMIDSTNKVIVPFQYESIEPINTFFKAKANGKYFIFNSKGIKISDQGFDDVGVFLNWKCRVVINKEHKYINGDGKILIEDVIKNSPIDGFKTLEDLIQNFILILNTDDDVRTLDLCKKITADEYSCEYMSRSGYDYTRYFERRLNTPYEERVKQLYNQMKEITKDIKKKELVDLSVNSDDIKNTAIEFSYDRENIEIVSRKNFKISCNNQVYNLLFDQMFYIDGYWKVFPFIRFY